MLEKRGEEIEKKMGKRAQNWKKRGVKVERGE